jgi:hypothetical protein
MAEAAMLTACMLGKRFAIVTFAQALGPWYQECVESHGLTGRLAGIRMLGGSFASVSDVQDEKEDLLVQLANAAVEQDEADVVILAARRSPAWPAGQGPHPGAGGRPDGRSRQAGEALVSLNVRKATAGTFRRPAAKATLGLPPGACRPLRPAVK